MKREYWQPEHLHSAALMLEQAAKNVVTTWPYGVTRPDPIRLEAAKALIKQALVAIDTAQPTAPPNSMS